MPKLVLLLLAVLSVYVAAQPQQTTQQSLTNLEDTDSKIYVKSIGVLGGGSFLNTKIDIRALSRLANSEIKKRSQPISIDELHQISDILTLYVRNQGFSFHTVYLPPQQVNRKHIAFRYAEAKLTDVNVINSSKIKDSAILTPFRSLLGKALYAPKIENVVFALRAQKNIQIFPYYSRGKNQGEVRLNIKVLDRSTPLFSVSADNYGSETSGKHRIMARANIHGLFSTFDQLSVSLLTSVDAETTTHGFIQYRRPFSSLKTEFTLSAGNSDFDIGKNFETLQMSGSSRNYNLDIRHSLSQHPNHTNKVRFGAFKKDSKVTSGFSNTLSNSTSSTGGIVGWYLSQQRGKFSVRAGADLTSGEYTESLGPTDGTNEATTFNKLSYFFNSAYPIAATSRLAVTPELFIRGQYAQDALPGIESSSLSGSYAVKAFAPGSYSSDSATVSSLKLYFPRLIRSPTFRVLPYLFYDYGTGTSFYPEASTAEITTSLSGGGLGINIQIKSFSASLCYATPTHGEHAGLTFNADDQWLFEIRWH